MRHLARMPDVTYLLGGSTRNAALKYLQTATAQTQIQSSKSDYVKDCASVGIILVAPQSCAYL